MIAFADCGHHRGRDRLDDRESTSAVTGVRVEKITMVTGVRVGKITVVTGVRVGKITVDTGVRVGNWEDNHGRDDREHDRFE